MLDRQALPQRLPHQHAFLSFDVEQRGSSLRPFAPRVSRATERQFKYRCSVRRSGFTVRFKDIVADLRQLAGRLFKVGDAQRRPTFVDLECLHEHPMARRRSGRKVSSGYVRCERTVSITLPKQVNEHRLSLIWQALSRNVNFACAE